MATFDFTPDITLDDLETFREFILPAHNDARATNWVLAEDYLQAANSYQVTIADRDITPPWHVLAGVDPESVPSVREPDLRFFPVWPFGQPEDIPPMIVIVSWSDRSIVGFSI